MDAFALVIALLIGMAAGIVVGYALARSRQADTVARAAAAEEKLAYVETQLAERFQALSTRALDANNLRFLELADGRMERAEARAAGELEQRKQAVEHLVTPLREALGRVEAQLREADAGRRTTAAELAKQVDFVRQSSDALRTETQALVTALRRPEARGRWGEMQLRRVAELAGMAAHCDFDEQATVATADGTKRPDMVVRLAGDKNIVVDSKVSLAAYLEAAETSDEAHRRDRLAAHARHLRQHVDSLGAKSYWSALTPSPEFVVLFIPGEAFLAPALDQDPLLLEYAMARRVHIATPTTLVSMLRTAQYAWQQQALSENARAVFDLGKELYERLGGLGRHLDGLGKALTRAVASYNAGVGSFETRVLVSARKLSRLGVVNGDLDGPEPVEDGIRALSAPELVDDAEDGRALRAVPRTEGPPGANRIGP